MSDLSNYKKASFIIIKAYYVIYETTYINLDFLNFHSFSIFSWICNFTFCKSSGLVTWDNQSSVSLTGSIPNLNPNGSLVKKYLCKNSLTDSKWSSLASMISMATVKMYYCNILTKIHQEVGFFLKKVSAENATTSFLPVVTTSRLLLGMSNF